MFIESTLSPAASQIARRFTVFTAGKALPHLRQQSQAQGQWLLQGLYPMSNSASLVINDWHYNTEVGLAVCTSFWRLDGCRSCIDTQGAALTARG